MSNTEYKSAKDAVEDTIEDTMNDCGIMNDIDDTSNIKVTTFKIKYRDASDIEEPDNSPINSNLLKRITGAYTSDELGNIIDELSTSNDLCVSALKK